MIVCMTKYKMLEYDRIDLYEGIESTKNKLVSRECSLCGFLVFY